jgi:hypothetical protein
MKKPPSPLDLSTRRLSVARKSRDGAQIKTAAVIRPLASTRPAWNTRVPCVTPPAELRLNLARKRRRSIVP